MAIDAKIRLILLNRLNFSPRNLRKLEHNHDLLSRTLGLIELMRQKDVQKERKIFVRQQLKKIRLALERESQDYDLMMARAAYYSFHEMAS